MQHCDVKEKLNMVLNFFFTNKNLINMGCECVQCLCQCYTFLFAAIKAAMNLLALNMWRNF